MICNIGMVKSIFGTYKVTYHPDQDAEGKGEPIEVDFSPPFRRVDMLGELQKVLEVKFPDIDLGTEGNSAIILFFFDKKHKKYK